MAVAEVLLKIKNESGRTLQELTDSSEQYDATLKQVVADNQKVEAAERQKAAALGLTVTQLRQVEGALQERIDLEREAAEAARQAAEAAKAAAAQQVAAEQQALEAARQAAQERLALAKQLAAAAQSGGGATAAAAVGGASGGDATRIAAEQAAIARNMTEVAGAAGEAAEAVGGLDKANWQAVQGAQSFKKNLGDIFDSLLAGQPITQVALQQFPALIESLTMGGSAAAVLKQALGGLFSSLGILGGAAAVLGTAFYVTTSVIDDYTEATDRAKAAQDALKAAMQPLEDALAAARKEQQLLNDALESGSPKKYLEVAEISASVDKREAEATASLRAEYEALKTKLIDTRFEASKDGILATHRVHQIEDELAAIHRKANELAQLEVRNNTVRTSIDGMAAADAKAAREAEKDAKDRIKAAKDEADERIKYMKSVLDAFQRMAAAQKVLHDAIISNDPLAQENDRYQAYTDSILAATDALAAQAVHEGNLAEATRIRMEGLKALDAARLQHFQNTGAQGATNDAFLYDQGLGGPSAPATAPTKQGITAAQGLEAATSLSSLVKLDPTGIASGVYAGMKAAIDVGKGGGALGELKTMLDDLGGALPGLAGGIKDLVKGILSDSIPALFDGAADAMLTLPGDLIDGLLDGVPDIIGALAKDAPRLITEMITLQPRVASALIAAILSPSTWVDAAKALADGLGDGLKSAWSDLGTMTQDIGKGLETGVEFLVRSAGSLYDGISSLFSADTWRTIGEEIADSLKDLFGGLFGREDKTGLFQKNGAISQAGESVGDWFTNAGKTVGRWFDKGLVGSFDVGTDYVSRTGLAVVHQGETIVPAHGATQAAAIQRAGNGGGMTVILQGAITSDEEALARRVQDAARRGLDFNGVSLG